MQYLYIFFLTKKSNNIKTYNLMRIDDKDTCYFINTTTNIDDVATAIDWML